MLSMILGMKAFSLKTRIKNPHVGGGRASIVAATREIIEFPRVSVRLRDALLFSQWQSVEGRIHFVTAPVTSSRTPFDRTQSLYKSPSNSSPPSAKLSFWLYLPRATTFIEQIRSLSFSVDDIANNIKTILDIRCLQYFDSCLSNSEAISR
jgi:hypothetical protein